MVVVGFLENIGSVFFFSYIQVISVFRASPPYSRYSAEFSLNLKV